MEWDAEYTGYEYYNCRKTLINLQEAADALEEYSYAGMAAFISGYVDEKHEREAEVRKDVRQVRLMNLHKAKGLEGKIVIIPDRGRHLSGRINPLKEDRKYYETVSYRSDYGSKTIATFVNDSDITGRAEAATQLDQERLEYVAATRAAEVLIFMGGEAEDGPFGEI